MRIKKPIAFMGIGVCLFLAAFVSAQYEVPKQTGPDSTPFQWPKGKRAAISLTFDSWESEPFTIWLDGLTCQ